MSTAAAAPLAGIHVVDLGQYIAGPGAAMVLAELDRKSTRLNSSH